MVLSFEKGRFFSCVGIFEVGATLKDGCWKEEGLIVDVRAMLKEFGRRGRFFFFFAFFSRVFFGF